jgi:hypothetical protein
LGDLLPFAAEFWRRYMTSLLSRVLEMSFPSTRMVFPFPPPFHWRNYERMFNCPIDFSAETMEWHFNADVLGTALPKCQSDHGEDLPAGVRRGSQRTTRRFGSGTEVSHGLSEQSPTVSHSRRNR